MEQKTVEIKDIFISDVKFRPIQEKSEQYLDLCRGVRIHGVQQPILLRHYVNPETKEKVSGLYELCDGQQRLGASIAAGLTTVPAHIDPDMSDDDLACRQLMLNTHRVKPTLSQVLSHVKQYMFRHPGKTQSEVASDLGFTLNQLSRILKQSNLIDTAKKLVDKGDIKPSAAYVLASLPPENQEEFIKKAMTTPIDEFIHIVAAEKKAIAAVNRGQKKADVIVPIPLKRPQLVTLWEVCNDEVERFEGDNPEVLSQKVPPNMAAFVKYIELKERYKTMQVVLQVDPETLARKKAEQDEKKASKATARAEQKRKEAEEILEKLKNEQRQENKETVESLA